MESSSSEADKPPFENCFDVSIDLCVTGIQHACAVFIDREYSLPTVLWVSSSEYAFAGTLLDMLPQGHYGRKLTPIVDPAYRDQDWWSVGTHLNKGYGSIGA